MRPLRWSKEVIYEAVGFTRYDRVKRVMHELIGRRGAAELPHIASISLGADAILLSL